jgi:hypothetical protein
MQVPAQLSGSVWGKWLSKAPPPSVDTDGDAFLKNAREWLVDVPCQIKPSYSSIYDPLWNYALLRRPPSEEEDFQALLIAITRYQVALLKSKEDDVSLGTDRLQQAIATMIFATASASIATTLGLTAVITGAVFAAIGGGAIGISYAMASVRRNSIKARRNRMINEIYDALESIVLRLSAQ